MLIDSKLLKSFWGEAFEQQLTLLHVVLQLDSKEKPHTRHSQDDMLIQRSFIHLAVLLTL